MRFAWLACFLPLLGGCGTVLFDLDEDRQVLVESEPAGARLWIDGRPSALRTPCLVPLAPDADHLIDARWSGPEGIEFRARATARRRVQPWRAIGDYLLPLGSVWVFTDWLTGALYEFDPVVLRLIPTRLAPAPSPPADPVR